MDRSAAEDRVRLAREELQRIKDLHTQVEATERRVAELTRGVAKAREALEDARRRQTQADAAVAAAEEAARAEESDPTHTDTQLQLRRTLAERAAGDAQQRIDTLLAVKKLADAASAAELDLQEQQAHADRASEALSQAEAREKRANEELTRCSLLERALEIQAAEKQVRAAQAAVDNKAALEARLEVVSRERAFLVEQRGAITVPAPDALAPMRKLATDLANAQGALEVGIVVTVTPHRPLDLKVERDGAGTESISIAQPQEIEANTELEIALAGIVTFGVRGGRREAQARAAALENRWNQEVATRLLAAGVADLDGLTAVSYTHLDVYKRQ